MNTNQIKRSLCAIAFLMATGGGYSGTATAQVPANQSSLTPRSVAADDVDLPRFYYINEKISLGAQPSTMGLRKIADMGFKTVVNCTPIEKGSMLEAKSVDFYGLKFIPIDMSVKTLDDALVAEFFETIDNKENQPIFIHCKTGENTAALWMLYRIRKQGWQFEEALKEATALGLHDSPLKVAVLKFLKPTR